MLAKMLGLPFDQFQKVILIGKKGLPKSVEESIPKMHEETNKRFCSNKKEEIVYIT